MQNPTLGQLATGLKRSVKDTGASSKELSKIVERLATGGNEDLPKVFLSYLR
jgi:hypothetical protein